MPDMEKLEQAIQELARAVIELAQGIRQEDLGYADSAAIRAMTHA